MKKALPSFDRVRELFDYDPETGILRWKLSPARSVPIGSIARIPRVSINWQNYHTHRIIWLWMTGNDPGYFPIDHHDLDQKNNRWTNLRLATNSLNSANRPIFSNHSTGFKGVTKRGSSYRSHIRKDGIKYNLGTFSSPQEAHAAYALKAIEFFGEFARTA